MSLTVYYAPMSSATRILWALEELGLPYDKVKVDLAKGEQKTPEYLALNPNGKVPLLVADGTPIFESIAILAYLGETYGVEKGLFAPPGLARAHAWQWMVWAGVTLGEAASRLMRNTHERYPAEQRNAAAAEAARVELRHLIGILNTTLAASAYLVGGSFSFADIPAYGYCSLAERFGTAKLEEFPRVFDWVERCKGRAALARAQAI